MNYRFNHERAGALAFTLAATIFVAAAEGQAGDPATLIKEKLVSDIKLTKASASHDDIVTAGDVVVLHKEPLMMCSSASTYADSNTYINGVLKADQRNRMKDSVKHINPFGGFSGLKDTATGGGCTERKFVSGEKFWVTDVRLGKNGNSIIVSTFSDPYNDVRYYGEIEFPFPNGHVPPVDDFMKTVSEVITVQPADDKAASGGNEQASQSAPATPAAAPTTPPAAAPSSAASAQAPAAPMQALAPPPPPTDAPPPTLEVGQTADKVVAGFGQPVRVDKLSPTKQIYIYKDMRITFVNGKVSNIEEK